MANSKINFLTAEEKKLLLDRYSDFDWSDDVTSLRCVGCHRVAIQHLLSNCHHIYCNYCIEIYKPELHKTCPQCQDLVSDLDQDWDIEISIHKLKCNCPNKKYGCSFMGQLRNIPDHMKQCGYNDVSVLSVKNSRTIPENTSRQLTNVIVANEKIKEEIKEMKTSFKNEMIALDKKLSELEFKVDTKVNEFTTYLNEPTPNAQMAVPEDMSSAITQGQVTYHCKFLNYNKTITMNLVEIESDVLLKPEIDFGVRLKLVKVNNWVKIQMKLINLQNFIRPIDRRAFATVTYVLKDLYDQNQDITAKTFLIFDEPLEYDQWFMQKTLIAAKRLYSRPYLKDNDILIQVTIAPLPPPTFILPSNGIVLWKVANYSKRKQMETDGLIFYHQGPQLYTSPTGYKCQIGVHLNFNGELIVKTLFVTGDHDGALPKRFPHIITATLIHQNTLWKTISKGILNEKPGFYKIFLTNNAVIKEGGFVYNDSILIKVEIEPILLS